jgi:hypothetical protein
VWNYNATDIHRSNSEEYYDSRFWEDNGEEEAATLAPTVIADATTENIEKAKDFIHGLTASGGNVAVCIVDRTAF